MLKLLAVGAILVPGLVLVDGKRREKQAVDRGVRVLVLRQARPRITLPIDPDDSNRSYGSLGLRASRTTAEEAWGRILALKVAAGKCMVAASYNK